MTLQDCQTTVPVHLDTSTANATTGLWRHHLLAEIEPCN